MEFQNFELPVGVIPILVGTILDSYDVIDTVINTVNSILRTESVPEVISSREDLFGFNLEEFELEELDNSSNGFLYFLLLRNVILNFEAGFLSRIVIEKILNLWFNKLI